MEEKLFFMDEKKMDTVVNCILYYDLVNLIHDVSHIELTYACNWGLFFPFQQACLDIDCNKRVCWNALVSTYVPHHHEYSVCIKRELTENVINVICFLSREIIHRKRAIYTCQISLFTVSKPRSTRRGMVVIPPRFHSSKETVPSES